MSLPTYPPQEDACPALSSRSPPAPPMPNQTASSDAAGTCSFLLLTVVTDSNATAGAAIPAQTTVAVAGTYFFSMLTVATDVNTSDTGRQTDVPDIETECGEDILKGDDDSEFGDD